MKNKAKYLAVFITYNGRDTSSESVWKRRASADTMLDILEQVEKIKKRLNENNKYYKYRIIKFDEEKDRYITIKDVYVEPAS